MGYACQPNPPMSRWRKCFHLAGKLFLIANSVMNVVTDIMILCLPIRYVVRLQMKRTRKLQVLAAFGLGGM